MDRFFTEDMLYEDIYSGKRKSFAKVDRLFQEIIDSFEGVTNVAGIDRKLVAKNFTEIKGIIKSNFNIQLDLIPNYDIKSPTNVAYTQFSRKTIEEAVYADMTTILANKKDGYHYVKLKKANTTFEMVSMLFLTKMEGSEASQLDGIGKRIVGKHPGSKLTGAMWTSILLHELGHNLFLRFHYREDNGKHIMRVENGLKTSPRIVIHEDKVPYSNKMQLGRLLLTLAIGAFLTVVAIKTSFIAAIPLIYLGSLNGIFNSLQSKDAGYKQYMRNERMANMLPFQYGYGQEVFQGTIMIHLMFSLLYPGYSKMDKKANTKRYNYQTVITRDILHMIEDEMKNPSNNADDIKYLKDLKSYYYGVIKDLQKEYGMMHTEKSDIDSVR